MYLQICRGVTIVLCCGAAIQLFDTFGSAVSAPQQAAGAAMSAAMAIIPYVFTRMIESWMADQPKEEDSA